MELPRSLCGLRTHLSEWEERGGGGGRGEGGDGVEEREESGRGEEREVYKAVTQREREGGREGGREEGSTHMV